MKKNITLLLDFDSTFITGESFDMLGEIVLQGNNMQQQVVEQLEKITKQAMEGKISYPQALAKRLQLFQPHETHLALLTLLLKKSITPSIEKHKEFFQKHKEQIYILSGGFREYIEPTIEDFGLDKNHVLANTFLFDEKGNVVSYDKTNPLAQERGKVKVIEQMKFSGDVYLIGDGYTDYEVKETGLIQSFFAFTENVHRESVLEKADIVVKSFDEVLEKLIYRYGTR